MLVRMINNSLKWSRDRRRPPWMQDDDVPGELVIEMRPISEDGDLSVWALSPDQSNLDDILLALATSRERLQALDFLIVPTERFVGVVELKETAGRTPFATVQNLHRDLIHVGGKKLVVVTKIMFDFYIDAGRKHKPEIVELLLRAITEKRITLNALPPSIRDEMTKHMARA